jgi:hypothetical protein
MSCPCGCPSTWPTYPHAPRRALPQPFAITRDDWRDLAVMIAAALALPFAVCFLLARTAWSA